MIKKLFYHLKKRYNHIRVFTKPHPLYNTFDRVKLSKLKKGTSKKGSITIKPHNWKHSIKLRKNFIDREVIDYVLVDQYHLPPPNAEIPNNAIILDLGSNIGLTIAHMKHLYPDATIYGYEMNVENFLLAKRNTSYFNRVYVFNNAIWINDQVVSYSKSSDFDAYSISKNTNKGEQIDVQGITIPSIIKQHNLSNIDYIKMDIEGAEKDILIQEDLSWLRIVKALNIEMHLNDDEILQTYIDILINNGFKAWKDDKHWCSIFAINLKLI